MTRITAAVDEIEKDFDRYLDSVIAGGEVIVLKDGKEVGRIVPAVSDDAPITESLTGILKENAERDEARSQALKEKLMPDIL